MKENKLADLSMDFSVKIIGLVKTLKANKETIISNQIGRSGTSIGANVAEAQRAQSKADFASKMSIALKEANETFYWLRLLYRTDYLTKEAFNSLHGDTEELLRILTAICKTATATPKK